MIIVVVKIFWKPDCAKCPDAKKLGQELENENIDVKYFDISDVNGLTEAVMYDIMATPSIIITDKDNKEKIKIKEEKKLVIQEEIIDKKTVKKPVIDRKGIEEQNRKEKAIQKIKNEQEKQRRKVERRMK